jgi:hypothetical protein
MASLAALCFLHAVMARFDALRVSATLGAGPIRAPSTLRLFALAMWGSFIVCIESEQGVDIVALALGLSAKRPTLFQRCQTERKILCRRRDVRIEQETERNSPIGNRAFRKQLPAFRRGENI